MAKINGIKNLGYGMGGLFLVLACAPSGGYGPGPIIDDTTDDGGSTTESSAGGGEATGCTSMAPQQTYLCAGSFYEGDAAGAAAMELSTEPANYACIADQGWPYYYYYDDYPYYDSGDGDGYYDGTGGASTGDGDGDGDGDGSGGIGFGGASPGGSTGAGGSPGGWTGAGGSAYPGGDLLSDWCEGLDRNDMVTGASFAVGECQLTDLALPIKITEPQYGNYQVSVYGGQSACDRDVLLAKTAGFGTGLAVNIPVDTSGYAFVSVEMTSDYSWENVQLRLVDRPAVGDAPSE